MKKNSTITCAASDRTMSSIETNRQLICASITLATLWPLSSSYSQAPHVFGTLDWREVIAGTSTPVAAPNGVVELGEGALVRLSLSFSPSVGTPVTYQFPPPGGVAPVAGFSRALFALVASGANGGAWSNLQTEQGFTGSLGIVMEDGSLVFANVRQPAPVGGAFPLPTNPLPSVWRAVWTPADYGARTVSFLQQPPGKGPADLFVHTGQGPNGPLFGFADAGVTYGQIHIPVVPGPGAWSTVGIGIAARRRRR